METVPGHRTGDIRLIEAGGGHARAGGELVRLYRRLEYAGLGSDFIDAMHDDLGGYESWFRSEIEHSPFAATALIEQRFAGIAVTALTEIAGRLHLNSLFVEAEYQGRGVGSCLLEAVEDFARAQGFAAVSLMVFEGNAEARKLYERNGFRQIERKSDTYYGAVGAGLLMLKDL